MTPQADGPTAPYARAREGDASDLELATLKMTAARAMSAVRRLRWREAMQRRAAAIAAVLRIASNAIIATTRSREKRRGAWLVRANGVAALTVATHCRARTEADLAAPLRVVVHRRDLVNMSTLAVAQDENRIVVEEHGTQS